MQPQLSRCEIKETVGSQYSTLTTIAALFRFVSPCLKQQKNISWTELKVCTGRVLYFKQLQKTWERKLEILGYTRIKFTWIDILNWNALDTIVWNNKLLKSLLLCSYRKNLDTKRMSYFQGWWKKKNQSALQCTFSEFNIHSGSLGGNIFHCKDGRRFGGMIVAVILCLRLCSNLFTGCSNGCYSKVRINNIKIWCLDVFRILRLSWNRRSWKRKVTDKVML